ncbi:MAG: NAD(+) synthase [Firmicutes bacterium]|nr:NAD(+) synthase [Bacillota bacterium]
MSIVIGQMEVASGDPARNKNAMLQMIGRAKEMQADLLVFPEACLSGLFLGENFCRRGFFEDCQAFCREVAQTAQGLAVVFGVVEAAEGKWRNSVYLAADGQLQRLQAPMGDSFAPGYYQDFLPAAEGKIYTLSIDGKDCRIGFLTGDWRGKTLPYAANDLDLLIHMALEPLLLDNRALQPAVEGRPFLRVNGAGLLPRGKHNYLYSGGSYYMDAEKRITHRAQFLQSDILDCRGAASAPLEAIPEDAALAQALTWGVRLFCRHIGVGQAVIGISGGIDSALAACVYSRALGPENVLLVSMPSQYNSELTQEYAYRMSQGLQTDYVCLPIQKQVDYIRDLFREKQGISAAGEPLSFHLDGFAMENVQARERTRLLAAISAARKAIFSNNGNKAELSVGYCTFYGDLAGAFAAAADLWKFQVYQAARYMQTLYPQAPLAEIAALRPSAELSPNQDVTKGMGDPLRYAYHDHLLRGWVEKGLEPGDVLAAYRQGRLAVLLGCDAAATEGLFPTDEAFIEDLQYWWRCYNGSGVAKRMQAPPMLALTRRPLGGAAPETQGAAYLSRQFLEEKRQLLGGDAL